MVLERRVKAVVKKLLDSYSPAVWYFMPVQRGLGCKRGVPDFVGVCNGCFFSVETKAPGRKPTKLQWHMMSLIGKAGGKAFVIDSAENLPTLEKWLEYVSREC